MKKIKKIFAIAFLWFFIITIFGIVAVEAQTITFKPQVDVPGFGTKTFGDTGSTQYIAQYVAAIYKYGISIGAILATVVLMAAGLMWLTSGGSQEKIGQAKNYISGSIIGLVLLFGSYILLNTINPELVNFHISDIKTIQELSKFCHPINGIVIESKGAKKCAEHEHCIGNFITDEIGEGYDAETIEWFKYDCISIMGCCEIRTTTGIGHGYRCEDEHDPNECRYSGGGPGGAILETFYTNKICNEETGRCETKDE